MDVQEYRDIAYLPSLRRNKQRELDLYVPSNTAEPGQKYTKPGLICFVHGGAWRSEDKSDHALLARRIALATGFAVAVPNYRLTAAASPLRHPAHAEDVLSALSFLLSWHGPLPPGEHRPKLPYDHSKLFLVGHSCGAHIISSIVLDSSKVTPSLTPHATSTGVSHTPHLLSAIQAVVLSEGIYDLDLLISSFPKYKDWFIAPSFGPRESYTPYSVNKYPLRQYKDTTGHDGKHIRWLIIQSKGDTLIDIKQAKAMYQHLTNLLAEVNVSDLVEEGSADKEPQSLKVERNWENLEDDHDQVLLGEQYVEIVRDFIMENTS